MGINNLSEINPAVGGVENYVAAWQTRIASAKEQVSRAQDKSADLGEAQLRAAQENLAKVQEEYEEFLKNHPEAKDHLQAGTERVQ